MAAGRLAGADPARKPQQRNRRGEFSLLIVRGDGVRVLRFNFVRTAAVAAFVSLACMVSVTAALFGDWVKLRELTRDAVVMHQQLIEQRAAMDRFNRRIAELRSEMAGWRDMHAKIWEPFGPELTPGGRDKGVGGPAPSTDRPAGRLTPSEELNKLGDGVRGADGQPQGARADDHEGRARAGGAAVAVAGAGCRQFRVRQSPVAVDVGQHRIPRGPGHQGRSRDAGLRPGRRLGGSTPAPRRSTARPSCSSTATTSARSTAISPR